MPQALPAVTVPPSASGGTPGAAGPGARRSARRGAARRAATPPTGTISASKPPGLPGGRGERVRAGGVGVLPGARDAGLLGQHVRGVAHVRVADRLRRERRPLVALRRSSPAARSASGAVDADSTPPASTHSRCRPQHRGGHVDGGQTRCRTAGRRSAPAPRTGSPAASAATRATSPPGPMQLPSTTSRGGVGRGPRRARASTGAARSAAVTSASAPPAVPMGVRSAATTTGLSDRLTR